jgi:MFS family permease
MVRSLAMSPDQAARLDGKFAKLWAASTTSALGSGLATIATPLFVASRTSSPLIVSAAFGVAWLPWLLFALPGGVLVDRVDRRRLMIIVDWSRVLAMGVLAAAVLTGWASIALLYVVLFVVNTGEIVFRSASQAMLPAVVPAARLERANGWLVGGDTVAQQLLAGPVGGLLFVAGARAAGRRLRVQVRDNGTVLGRVRRCRRGVGRHLAGLQQGSGR